MNLPLPGAYLLILPSGEQYRCRFARSGTGGVVIFRHKKVPLRHIDKKAKWVRLEG
jgi:hypothetical protein